ncbi:hypothetical protein JFK97_06800 [Chromobacterium phragmitis]|uniref:hypothetical protein n=1 Tax=Chromobacterium amazonense TaxID=1382803 RepID=UPI0021B72A3B|nr:hypothetical protein [Chromobacterium amazonense]MBM2884096.1 hypothetical protein [Chromobacterium amazonense]
MNGIQLQRRLYKQYGRLAGRVGLPHSFTRPVDPLHPMQPAPYAQQPASFNQEFRYARPNKYATPTWNGVFDGTPCKVGDYITGPSGTFFIAAMQQALPILVVDCNRTISILRETRADGFGQLPYGGDTPDIEQPLMAGWPASVLQGPKGEKNETGLPGDVRTPWWAILLPAWPTVTIRTSDIIADDLGRRYIVSSAELTDLGWRLTATQKQV